MNKKVMFVGLVAMMLFMLTGCGDNTTPIHGGVGWYEQITVVLLGRLLELFASLFSNSFAMGILFTTLVVRTIAWPIYAKTNSFSMKMQLLNPELQKLQAKYVGRHDEESKMRMQTETLALYRKYGVNPLGCLLVFLQAPIFMAMYSTVVRIAIPSSGEGENKIVSMFFNGEDSTLNTMMFGIDLSQGCGWNLSIILPILTGLTMFALQWLSSRKPSYSKNAYNAPKSQQAEQTEKMMKFMNVFMIFTMAGIAFSNAALGFYWVIGNVYAIGQNMLGRKMNERKYAKMKNDNLII